MSEIKNPMRFSIRHTEVDIEKYLRHPDFSDKRITKLKIRPGEGNVYIYWEEE